MGNNIPSLQGIHTPPFPACSYVAHFFPCKDDLWYRQQILTWKNGVGEAFNLFSPVFYEL